MADDTRTLDCGHQPSPHSDVTTGTAHWEGKEICWRCALENEREWLRTADKAMGYLTQHDDGPKITAWPGGELMRVTACWRRNVGFGGDRHYIRAVDVHGQRWYGTSPGYGMYARLRRSK